MGDIRRIGVMMEVYKPYKRHVSVFGGIRAYADQRPAWRLVIDDWADYSLPGTRRGHIPYDGIIGRITSLGAERAKRLNVPAVNVWLSSPAQGVPGVFPDFAASGELIADHLLSRGFRFFAAHLQSNDATGFRQAAAMERVVKDAAIDGWLGTMPMSLPDSHEEWQLAIKALTGWMDNWKLPLGLVIREPGFARWIIQLAQDRGWSVPQQLAIVSSMNDEMQCENPEPALTGVEHAYDKVGYEAAKMLDHLIDVAREGKSPFADPKTVLVPPVGIVSRHSTDFFAASDTLVQAAMRYIAANLAKPLEVEKVAEHLKVSRRLLDMRFHRALGVTVAAEIARLRLERVKRELTAGSDSIETIARRSGFGSVRTLNDHFQRTVGMSPRAYRKQGDV